ncbi:MAG: DUF2490 domain-containing protein [Bacteroidales bacterium]|nr:DUF2490 domain-containing protein [Bacteroidales bacterium]
MRKLLSIWAVCALLMSLYNNALAQTESRQLIYLGAGIEKELSRKLSAGLDMEGRFCHEKGTQSLLITPSLEYSPIKYLSGGLEYRAEMEHENGSDAQWTGRLGVFMKAKFQPSFLRLESRIKYCNYTEDYEDEGNLQYFRTRFQAGARIKSIKLTPYFSYEWFYNISRHLVDKDRYVVGIKKKIDKRNTVGFEYMLEEKFNRGKTKPDINKNIFAFNYQYEIPASKKKNENVEKRKQQ